MLYVTAFCRRASRLDLMKHIFALIALICIAGCATTDASKESSTLRVMTYNIHHGEGLDGRIDLERIAALIKQEKADIVSLQEVDRGVLRTQRRDLPAELSKLTGMNVYFDGNLKYQGGDYGNAVLTRFPILQSTNTHYKMLEPNEHRGVIQLVLDVNGRKLLLMNTHLDFHPNGMAERLLHVQTMKELIDSYKLPVIVCGDFNSTPDSKTHSAMKQYLRDTWEVVGKGRGNSFSSDHPSKRIDYLWISSELQPVQAWLPKTTASDHLPVVAEFRLR